MTDDAIADFRREVRQFVAESLPVDIREKVVRYRELEKQDFVRWQKILHARGWLLGGWKKEWGGAGWDPARQLAFLQESAAAGAPAVIPYGVSMVGPVLNQYGTDAQKEAWLPGIVTSDTWWCQGYSEPGAGSDLAALKTSAVRRAADYVVNGSKLWTTEAHWADMMHCLVRTDASGRKQDGISYLLIDMRSPGITVRPIITIDGQHHTNEVFFDDVVVPAENLVGVEGGGWSIAKFLLSHERLSISDSGPKLRLLNRLREMTVRVVLTPGVARAHKAAVRARLADLQIQLETLRCMERRFTARWCDERAPGIDPSILKIRGVEILQDMAEFAVELAGPYAGVHDPDALHRPADGQDDAAVMASAMAHQYLYSRCWSILGGSNEVQRNVIAKAVLSQPA